MPLDCGAAARLDDVAALKAVASPRRAGKLPLSKDASAMAGAGSTPFLM